MVGAMRRGGYQMYEYIACSAGRRGEFGKLTWLPAEPEARLVLVDGADGN
jgi:hypothetical protein